MKLVRQPDGSNLCGQSCVAMLANVSLEDSISAFGTRGATTTKEVVTALRKLGVKCGDRLLRTKRHEKTSLCIVKLHFSWSDATHWAIFSNGTYFDPAIGVVDKYPDGVRETSFLPIRKELEA